MGMVINIDQALELRSDYNVLKEPLNKMLSDMQEAWERENPIDLLFKRGTIDRFQQTYTSSIGFDKAFKETSDYAVGPIFNTAEGFSATYTTRTFQGSFIITQQVLEDGNRGQVKDDAAAFMKRWHAQLVEYAIAAIGSGFGKEVWYEDSRLKLTSADTTDGDIHNTTKNPLFYKEHTCVKRKGMEDSDVVKQSNIFGMTFDKTKPEKVSLMADFINQVITKMENYRDDNGKRAGVMGSKVIVAPNDAHLKAILNAALSMDMFGQEPNVAYQRATLKTTPYLNDIPCCANGVGFFIVDPEYNAANHGPEFTERIPLTLDVIQEKRPAGIVYDGRQRFDINVCSWRGIVYCYVGSATGAEAGVSGLYETITPISTVKPVAVVNTVKTSA